MENVELIHRTCDEKCSECGMPITYKFDQFIKKNLKIICPCVMAKKESERQHHISKGKNIIHTKMRKLSGMKLNQRKFFIQDIIARAGQEKALQVAKSFISRYTKENHTTGIIFSGGVGSGKTLLSAAISNAIIDNTPIEEHEAEEARQFDTYRSNYVPVRFVSTVELFEELRATFDSKNCTESAHIIIDALKKAPLVILDDMGAEKPSDWVRERLFEIIDYRNNEDLPIIVSTNLTPKELKIIIGDRNHDRLREKCIYVKLTAKSQRITAKLES